MKTGIIEQRDDLSYEEFIREYLRPGRPVVIRNAFPEWRALSTWTPDFFRERYGDREIRIGGEVWRFGDFLDRVVASTPDDPVPYLREQTVRALDPALGADLTPFVKYALPNWLRGVYPHRAVHRLLNRASEVELFIGGAGTRLERRRGEYDPQFTGLQGEGIRGFADLHYDPTACPVVLCQIFGHKEWTVFSPADTPHLYTHGRHSSIDNFDQPDFERFPLLRNATALRHVQAPGEAIFCPQGWWHTTRMRSVSIAVGSTFANSAHWRGVVDDVVKELLGDDRLQARLLGAYLVTAGALKSRLGARLGESTHFRTPGWEKPLRVARGVVRSATGLVSRS